MNIPYQHKDIHEINVISQHVFPMLITPYFHLFFD